MSPALKQQKILVAADEVPSPVWTHLRTPVQVQFSRDGIGACQALLRERFDVLFLDLYLSGMDSLELLRRCRGERLCGAIVLTSEVPSFSYAQQGILYGVSAYLLRPLQPEEVDSVLRRLQDAGTPGEERRMRDAAARVLERFRTRNGVDRFFQIGQELIRPDATAVESAIWWRRFCEMVLEEAFQRYPWLALYHHPDEFRSPDFVEESDREMVLHFCRRTLEKLSAILDELFPQVRSQEMENILLLLLGSIDENIQQKDVAERWFITKSALSTRFQRNLGISYREYMTRLKIRRGQYLLRHTDIRPRDVAARLGYRDSGHFARLFLQRTSCSLQEYGRDSGDSYSI